MKILNTHVAQFTTTSAWGQVWVEPFVDLDNVEFGGCDLAMGIGVVGEESVNICGCGWEVDGIEYSPAFQMSFVACDSICLGDVEGCTYGVALNYSTIVTIDG